MMAVSEWNIATHFDPHGNKLIKGIFPNESSFSLRRYVWAIFGLQMGKI